MSWNTLLSKGKKMDKLAILTIQEINPEQNFKVTLEIGNEGYSPKIGVTENLPYDNSIFEKHENWREIYNMFPNVARLGAESGQLNNYSEEDLVWLKNQCSKAFEDLKISFNYWLENSDFAKLEKQLRSQIKPEERGRLLIQTSAYSRYLFWDLWDFFKDYPNFELAISSDTYQAPPPRKYQKKKVKILAIIGDRTGINTDEDELYLKQLPKAEVRFLKQPKPTEILKELWTEKWDIIFFAGHSNTDKQQKGIIYLNETDSLTIEEFKNGLEESIKNGLQIAIFNSCDGLGLARELEELNIPQVIVMREPIPDQIAHSFLKYFLEAFSKNNFLYLAVKEAKKRLEDDGWNKELPGSILLPVIYQNPGVIPPTWNELTGNKHQVLTKKGLPVAALTSIVCTGIVGIIRAAGLIQGWELSAYDTLMRFRPHSPLVTDERILIVTIDEADIQYQKEQKLLTNTGASLSDEALEQLLTKLEKVNPKVMGLDIYHPHSFEEKIKNKLNKNYPFYVICKTHSPNSQDTQPPVNISPEFWGFSDVILDSDGVVRRQLLSMQPQPTDTCKTDLSLNSLMAFYYLHTVAMEVEAGEKGWAINNQLLPKLTNHAGGYQKLDSRGSQILLNYRYYKSVTDVATSVSLTDVLTNGISGEYPIILIGVTAKGERYNDYFKTPYGEEIPGVFLQAQMISQILSSAENSQSVIWWLPVQLELIWIWGWSFFSGIVAYYIRQPERFIFAQIIIIGGLGVSCWLLFVTSGGWFPLVPPVIALTATTIVILIPRTVNTSQETLSSYQFPVNSCL